MREIVSPLSGIRSPFGQLTSVLAIYAVLGVKPELVFDFANERFFTMSGRTTFSDAITHVRNGNATMVDSDGVLKWAPHNLLLRSEEFDNASWGKTSVAPALVPVVTPDAGIAPDNTETAERVQFDLNGGVRSILTQSATTGLVRITAGVWAKSFDGTEQKLVISFSGVSPIEFTVGSTWVLLENPWLSNIASPQIRIGLQSGQSSVETCDVLLWGAHLYRSDLGGMAAVPADAQSFSGADTYAPTTTAAVYLPRRGHHAYNGSTWVSEGLLVETEARTNLFIHSNDFTAATGAWSGGNTGTLANDAEGPDGVATSATTLFDSNAGGTGPVRVTETVSVSSDTALHTFSFFAKADQLSAAVAQTLSWATGNGTTVFNLLTGEVTTLSASHSSASVEDYGNGWYRCSVSFIPGAGDTSGAVGIWAGDGNVDLDGTSSILIYGAQFEAASTPSSYIPTSGATVTRAAETLTVAAADLPYSATAMSIQMQGRMTYADTNQTLAVRPWNWAADLSNRMYTYVSTSSALTGRLIFQQQSAGVVDTVQTAETYYSPDINVPYNMASRHGSTFLNGATEGVALTANTTPTSLPNLSASNLSLANTYMGTVKLFRMWDQDLGDTGLEEATT